MGCVLSTDCCEDEAIAVTPEGPPKRGGLEQTDSKMRLTKVKAFVTQDIPLYHNLVMKHIPGADPELVLLSHYYEELDRIPLSDMTRSEINELLGSLGFYKKAQPDDPVPEEFQFSPAKDSPWREKRESHVQSSHTTSPDSKIPPETSAPESGHSDL